jgi:hypothetical protein
VEAEVADRRPSAAAARDDRARKPLEASGILRNLVEPKPQEAAVVLVRPTGWEPGTGRVAGQDRGEKRRREEDEVEPPRPDRR